MQIHHLKCWPEWFRFIRNGEKTAELRLDDRHFQVGDTLVLRGWDPTTEVYTGHTEEVRYVTHVLRDHPGLTPGYVMLSLVKEPAWR